MVPPLIVSALQAGLLRRSPNVDGRLVNGALVRQAIFLTCSRGIRLKDSRISARKAPPRGNFRPCASFGEEVAGRLGRSPTQRRALGEDEPHASLAENEPAESGTCATAWTCGGCTPLTDPPPAKAPPCPFAAAARCGLRRGRGPRAGSTPRHRSYAEAETQEIACRISGHCKGNFSRDVGMRRLKTLLTPATTGQGIWASTGVHPRGAHHASQDAPSTRCGRRPHANAGVQPLHGRRIASARSGRTP